MRLTVWLPTEILLQEEVARIKAEAPNGWFGLLPRHIDFVTELVPSVLTFVGAGGSEEYLAMDRGILVKCGPEVSVSARAGMRGTNLDELRKNVEARFRAEEEREKKIREICPARSNVYLPFVGTIFLFITICSLLEVVPGWRAPTGSLSTTAALAICVAVGVHVFGMAWGIELRGNGYKIGWTPEGYLDSLEENLKAALERQVEAVDRQAVQVKIE